jgi:hypothetical protein
LNTLMFTRVYLSLVLLSTTPVWSQIGSIPFETAARPSDEDRMLTPPPLTGEAYPTTVGSQARSNYLAAGLTFVGAYSDNVIVGSGTTPIGDGIYSILPAISLNQTTPRQQLTLQFSPGFTFYQNTSALNEANQTAALNFQYRMSQHTTISFIDSFQKSSNVFDQLPPLSGGPPSGLTQSSQAEVVAPYANQLSNVANAALSYQISRNTMIGAGGTFTVSNYSDSTQASGLSNSNSLGGSVFYNHRLVSTQYVGVIYQYLGNQANPVDAQANSVNTQTEVHTQTVLPFYTISLKPSLSLYVSGGPQYVDATQSSSLRVGFWTPSVIASISWQRSHTNFVAGYSRTVSGGTGLIGAFNSNSANTSARWQIVPTWTIGLAGGYSINKNALPLSFSSSPGGHTVSGTVMVQHLIGEHFEAGFGYVRLHQSYSSVAVISEAPDSDRGYVSVSYRFTRSLGR